MNREIQQQLQWKKLYEEYEDAGFVCRRYGISYPTLCKWWCRYQESSLAGLESQNKLPHTPATKVSPNEESLTLDLRKTRKPLN